MMATYIRRLVCLLSIVVLDACAAGDGAGGSWTSVTSGPAMQVVQGVWAFSATDVWFIDGTSTVRRFDGTTWSDLTTPASSGLGCIFALSPTDVWLCADGTVLHYDGATFDTLPSLGSIGLNGLTSIWATSASSVWAVGDDAIVAHYNGSSWSAAYATSGSNSSIWGTSPTNLYVLGTFGFFNYNGSSWSPVATPDSTSGDGQVWGTSASDVWVMTDSSDVAHFDGSQWQSMRDLNLIGELAAVWGTAADDLWAAGSAGQIAHFDGNAWSDVEHQKIGAPYLRRFLAVHGSAANDVWAVGQQLGNGGSTGVIYHH